MRLFRFLCGDCFCLVLALVVLGASPALAQVSLDLAMSQEELSEGWIELFDQQTLYGWQARGEANFRVEEEALVVDQGEVCLLTTTTQFSDFVLRLEVQADAETNSGIFLRSRPTMQLEDVGQHGYEVNIAPQSHPFPTGSLVAQRAAREEVHCRGWRTFEITVCGSIITVMVDGAMISRSEDCGQVRRGFIALQHNQGRAAFRNIRLKPLELEPLCNGQDLTGWREYPEMASRFCVNDQGELHVEDGRGQLETEAEFADFTLQLECYVNGSELNSGIFFRCMPGEEMMGYESQIHNGFHENDRTQPTDCGTGGIFRRADARIVAADDFTWLHMTIVAEGNHFGIWVNGRMVTDWVDQRAPNENPRRGLRREAGTIMIQGHDPTTDLSFRNLRAAEMHAR